MVKTNYNYQTKIIARKKLEDAIKVWVPDLPNAKVVCLPGNDAREVLEVYDSLGIRRKNIIGVERDRGVYENLKKLDLGIGLYFGEANNFLKENSEKFDVISLDYTELPSRKNLRLIRELFKNYRFSSRSILYTNFYAKHINVFSKVGLPYVLENKVTEGGRTSVERKVFWEDYKANFEHFKKELNVGLKEFRSDALTSFLIICSRLSDIIIKDIIYANSDEDIPKILKSNKGTTTHQSTITPNLPIVSELCTCRKCHKKFKHFKLTPYEFTDIFRDAFFDVKREYSIEDLVRFEYVSDDNSLMFSDILFINDNSDLINKVRSCVKGFSPKMTTLVMNGESSKEYLTSKRRFEEITRQYLKRLSIKDQLVVCKTMPPREDITPRKELDKDTAIKLLKAGWGYEMFERKFKNITPARIAAYKSHTGMGTYNEQKEPEHKKEEKQVNQPIKCVFKKGILFFDSNFQRSQKNLAKIDFGENHVDLTNILKGFKENPGILMRNQYDLYVINTLDDKANEAVTELSLRFCESNRCLNLLLIGNPHVFDDEINAARDLGAKVNISGYEATTGYIDNSKPINLESILSFPVRITVKKRAKKVERRPKLKLSEEQNQEIYNFIKAGIPKEEIMKTYSLSAREYGARKAWVTMRNR